MEEKFLRDSAQKILNAALSAVHPYDLVFEQINRKNNILNFQSGFKIDLDNYNNIYLIGIGKGVAPMARAMAELLGENLVSGDIIVKYEHGDDIKKINVKEAAHPIPDQNTLNSTDFVLNNLENLSADDMVFVLLTGGGSALFEKLPDTVNLQDLQDLNKELLGCGATIHEINCIRKHISLVKGGQLAKTIYPAKTVTLALSDVVGDDLSVIASGPTTPDDTTFAQAYSIIEKYNIENKIPKSILKILNDGNNGKIDDTPNSNDLIFRSVTNLVIGSNIISLISAEQEAKKIGFNTLILSSMIEGDVRELAKFTEAIIKQIQQNGIPIPKPACILFGGEPTLKLTGKGKGGRNQQLALQILDQNIDQPFLFISCGTDGTDGPTDAAGALVTNDSIKKATALKLNPKEYLINNDAYHFFSQIEDLIITGPTRTNVMDIMIALVP